MSGNQLVLVLIAGILIALALVLFLPTQRARRNTDTPADRSFTGPQYRDYDRHWLGGIIYYNRDDPDPFVPKRFGWGWTVNFGHPAGKVILVVMIGMVLLPVALAVFGVHLTPIGCHPSGCYGKP